MIELSNVYVLLANSFSQFDIIANFVIMLVVADFDNYFYSVRNPDHISRMIHDESLAHIYKWETTTSFDACAEIPENMLKCEKVLMMCESHERPKYIRMKFSDRNCQNKMLYLFFKTLSLSYTAFYYYFMPWISSLFIFFALFGQNKKWASDT